MGVLTDLQAQALHLMQSDSYYARVSLLTEQLGDIQAKIKEAIAKIGICAIVTTPRAKTKSISAPGPLVDLELNVDIVEFVMKNRGESGSKQSASDVAEHTSWKLHFPNHAHLRQDAYQLLAGPFYVVPDKNFLIYRVEFTTTGALAGIVTP